MSTSAENRGQFGSKLGFILSAAGSAVGLGNIWKFPGKAYFCGGGAFLIIYLIIVALIGATVMMAEFTVGRKTHKNAVGAIRELNEKWSWVGGLGVLTGFIILCYYCQVGGWAMKYIVAYIIDVTTIWADPTAYFLNNLLGADGTFPLQGAVIFPFIFLFLTAYIISHGTAGIEKMSKLLMPLLFIMLIALMIRSCTLPGADEGLKYMLQVDFSTINGIAILTALGQAFFSLSLGMGVMMTYASYLSSEDNLISNTAIVCTLDTLVALFAGFMIIPAVFATGIAPGMGGGFGFAGRRIHGYSRRPADWYRILFPAVLRCNHLFHLHSGRYGCFPGRRKGIRTKESTARRIRYHLYRWCYVYTFSGTHEPEGYLDLRRRYQLS